MPDPSSNGLHVSFDGSYTCHCWVKSASHQSGWSPKLLEGQSFTWSFDDLIKCNFSDGENCWIEVDVDAGPNHESGQNFILSEDSTFQGTYELNGSVQFPSWTREF